MKIAKASLVCQVANEICARAKDGRLTVAIDGRCGSGKTSLALSLCRQLGCEVIHMDHFFLPPDRRPSGWLDIPGGNIDRRRLKNEVLLPLSLGQTAAFSPFDCRAKAFGERITVSGSGIVVVEGTYSCHPEFSEYYDLKIFLTTESEEQRHRILLRNGEEELRVFLQRWIPLEENYFESCDTAKRCELVFET